MTPSIMRWLATVRRELIANPGRVLEVGSYDVNGSPRESFGRDAVEYVGIDLRPGPGVDIVGDVLEGGIRGLGLFDLVICTEVLEHTKAPVDVVLTIRRALCEGGYLILTSPANGFAEHRFPRDYWRIMPDAYREVLLCGMTIVREHTTKDPCHCFVARAVRVPTHTEC
jgi:SAM-dependent methyltransferase